MVVKMSTGDIPSEVTNPFNAEVGGPPELSENEEIELEKALIEMAESIGKMRLDDLRSDNSHENIELDYPEYVSALETCFKMVRKLEGADAEYVTLDEREIQRHTLELKKNMLKVMAGDAGDERETRTTPMPIPGLSSQRFSIILREKVRGLPVEAKLITRGAEGKTAYESDFIYTQPVEKVS